MSGTPPDIKSFDEAGLLGVLQGLGEPAYRTKQILRWLYGRGVASFEEMTDLPEGLRRTLAQRFAFGSLELVQRQIAGDGTRKYLWRLADGTDVESVGLPTDTRLTVCFSTQAGCGMGCTFCATGRTGLSRGLTSGEIVDQVSLVGRDFGRRVTNAVAMGQGEPFADYDATLGALRILNSVEGLGIGARHLTVSTCGLLPGIRRLAQEPEQFTLAVSLHSAVQTTRDRLMPGVRRYPLVRLRTALAEYAVETGRRPSLEYALIRDVNDTDAELDALIDFCRGLLCHVNLIAINLVDGAGLERPADARTARFERALVEAGVEVSVRAERGIEIDAACGQLRQRMAGMA